MNSSLNYVNANKISVGTKLQTHYLQKVFEIYNVTTCMVKRRNKNYAMSTSSAHLPTQLYRSNNTYINTNFWLCAQATMRSVG